MKRNPLNPGLGVKTGKDLLNLMKSKDPGGGTVIKNSPKTDAEKALYTIWSQLLGHDNFGINDDFFQVGGNSLKGVQVVSRISKQFLVNIQLTDIFLHPTISALGVFVEEKQKSISHFSGIVQQPRPELIPLSFSQERLWFIDQLEGSVQYHLPAVLQLKGLLDHDALEYALQSVVNRHEVLRTVFHQTEGQIWQHINEKNGWKLSFIDGAEYRKNPAGLQDAVNELIRKPFDLSADHMLRASLITLSEDEQILVVTVHHIASDGWSTSILVNEVVEIYNAQVEGRIANVSALEIQYADFAIWQRNHLPADLLEQKIKYWKEKLQEVTPLELPADFSRPAVWTSRGAMLKFRIDDLLTEQLHALSQQQGSTLFMTLISALKVLLHRYSGQEDICVGTGIAGRQQQELENLIGFFVNTIALRSNVKSEFTFTEFLQEVKASTLGASEHQDVPFEKVVDAVVTERDLGRNPLFQVMFVLQNTPEVPEMRLGDVQLSRKEYEHTTAQFDLSFSITETDSGLDGTVEYYTDLFSEETVQRLLDHYKQLLSSITTSPSLKIGEFSIMTKEEENQLLSEFNDTTIEYPRDKTIVELFEEQVQKTPNSIAIVFEEQKLTYQSLQDRSNQVANYLIEKGISQGSNLGLLSYRGIDMIIGMLGILKAGCTYVPFNIEYPAQRIQYIIEDASISDILFTDGELLNERDLDHYTCIDIKDAWSCVTRSPVIQKGINACAYIMFTSGTTGRPKGIAVSHKNIVKLVYDAHEISVKAEDRVLQWSNYSFDGSTYDIYSSLLRGASLHLIKDNYASDVTELSKVIEEQEITVCFMTTALFNTFTDIQPGALKRLRKILFGGEKVSISHVRKALGIIGPGKIIHVYGPTETTVYATYYNIDRFTENGNIPIGRPLSNTQLFVLDTNKKLVPAGVAGELYIGGDGVSRGYVNNEALTAEKFLTNPFSKEQTLFYRTGDKVRWLTDGNIEFLGRFDDQVKIRGYRIELGEVESVILQNENVRQAVVLAHHDTQGARRLVGYTVTTNDFKREDIIAYLKEKLPEYMIPAIWVIMDYLPLTPNGKVDKKALPDPDAGELLAVSYSAPRSQTEQTLADIWKDLLGSKRVGINDNFFELGGHSLLAMRLISAIRKELLVEVTIKDLFVNPTVAQLSSHLDQQVQGFLLPAIGVEERPELIPLSFSQERLWFIDMLEGSVQYHLPIILKLKGPLDTNALENALQQVINRHESLRTVIRTEEGQGYQFIKNKDNWDLAIIDGSKYKSGTPRFEQYIQELINTPFDLSKDYMIRGHLIQISEQENVLVLNMHHIASDAWSVPIIVEEVTSLYTSYTENHAPWLAPLPIQYADYSLWQRKYLQGEVLDKKLQYWKNKLDGLTPLQLPTDHPRPAVLSTKGAITEFTIDKELSNQLHTIAREHGVTMFMTLLASLKILLSRYSGQQDICVGSPVANRTQHEVEPLIGFFINSLALRSDLGSDLSFNELLQQVRVTTLEAYEHQDVPFEKVVDAVVKERDMSRSPLFQVMFAFENRPAIPDFQLAGIELSQQKFATTTAKFELTVNIVETPDGLQGSLEYSTDLYKAQTIQRMISHFKELLNAIASEPEQKISSISILTKPEEDQLLYAFNNTGIAYPKDKTIIDLFEKQVAEKPTNTALVFEKKKITYKDLNERSNKLAHYLRSKGVKEDSLVPICIERGFEMIVGLLGILKAGGAYVPIDPEYPEDRISYILEDTAAPVLISSEESKTKINASKDVEIISIDGDWELINKEPSANVKNHVKPENLAYVIYTSGSTGKPKGVLIEHRNVVRLFETDSPLYHFNEHDVWTMFHSFCFDFSVWEIYGALFYGGSVVVVPKEATRDVTLFSELLLDQKVTILNQTPSAFYVLQDQLTEKTGNVPIRYVIFGGEALNPSRLQPWKESYPDCRLVNMYGITETTVHVTYQEIEWQHIRGSRSVIGKTIPTLTAYILDRDQNLVPLGVAGELNIGGAGLARGYLNRPELTRERFIKDPFSNEQGARLYRTGDLARWLPDGNLEYLGRIDEQVKIRGYRIELGEIETVLQECSLVNQAVVLAKQDKESNKQLVGYIVPEGSFRRDEIVSFLKGKLPEYMIPALWVELESLPLTSNGKINKKALPDPDASGISKKGYVAPETEEEKTLANIWQEVLNLDNVGVNDNFFELGGDSIKVIRVVHKLKKVFKKDIKVFDIYHTTNLYELAKIIHSATESDTTALFSSIKEDLSTLKQNIIGSLQDAEQVEDIYPMSDIQSGMVYAALLNPELAIYHDQFTYYLSKYLDVDVFEKAISLLVKKHSILRTAFNLDIHTEGLQIVYKTMPFKIEQVDLKQAGREEAKKYIKEYLRKERGLPFEINKIPVWRATIIKLKENNAFIFQVHHAILDGWSVAAFNTELNNLYFSLLTHPQEVSVSPLKATYKDFVIESISDKKNEENNIFWLNEMSGYKRLNIFSRENVSQKLNKTYPVELLETLTRRTKKDGISLKSLFFGAYLYSMSMLTPEDEITVGLVSNTRPVIEDGDKLLGCFLNTIPCRVHTQHKNSVWKDYFESIEQKLVSLKERDRTTLLQITSLTGEKTNNENPFFDTLFSFTNFHVYNEFEQGLINPYDSTEEDNVFEEDSEDLSTNTYLNFIILLTGNVLKVHYRLQQKLKSGKSLQELNEYFDKVIECYLNRYEESIDRNSILTETDLQVLKSVNDFTIDYPKNKTVIDLFEEQVLLTPNAKAIVFEDKKLSYHELNERANQLAGYLRTKGVNEESLVPICIERSAEMLVGVIGILKAGAAYVPIDTDFPADRISYMMEDTHASIVISSRESRSKIDDSTDADVIEIDGDWSSIAMHSAGNVKTDLAPNNLAYVIYTSGSTGKPKGVMIEHRHLVDYVFGLEYKAKIKECKSFALVSTIATDLGNTVIYGSLFAGGTLHLFSKDATSDVEKLHVYFEENEIDCLKIVPSHWRALCTEDKLLLPARLLVFGGEALPTELVENIWSSGFSCRVVNHYGPTETTIGKLLHVTERGMKYGTTIPIGKPFSNTKVYVVNAELELCPVSVPGQLYISGDGLARGYFNNEELTREKFIQNPFDSTGKSLMYGTGDLVRYLADGNIEFIGRVDDQVKIRGYRIELGEIETALQLCELVSQAVVLAKEDRPGNKRLIAYIVPEGSFEREGIITHLKEKLPEYMIPALFIELESLPLTPNGKIDKKSLPDPEVSEMLSNDYAAPRNDAEKALVEIWQELLDVERIGIHDNFFELGGDSIITIQVVSRARREGYELQIGDVFTYQTIARLSSLLEQRSNASVSATGEQFLLSGLSGLLPVQQWYFEKEPEEISHFNQSLLLGIDKAVTESVLKRAIEELSSYHDALRFKYYRKDGVWHQVYEYDLKGVIVDDLQAVPASLLSERISENAGRHQRSLDIEKGDLVRVVLMQTPASENKNRLLVAIHHLAVDGVSWRILLEDLELLLTGILSGGKTDLGNKSNSYRQWYEALESYSQTERLLSQTGYWERVIKNNTTLPVDLEYTGQVQVKDTQHHSMKLGSVQTKQLLQDVPRVYHTEINDILISALAITLGQWNESGKVTIGMEGHGREAIVEGLDITRTVGWFTTHYPVMLELPSSGNSDELIKSVKEQLRQVPDKGIGYGVLKYINKKETFQNTPTPDILFNYLGQADNVLSSGKWLSVSGEPAGNDRSERYPVSNKISVNGMVQGGELVLDWTYSRNHYQQKTIQELVQKYLSNLEALISHCITQQKNGVVFTPSDYGLGSDIHYSELDAFLNESYKGKVRKLSIESIYRLSGLQQGMLFHGLYDGGGAGYINHFWCDLVDPDLDVLDKSWNEVIKKHSILRSGFYHDSFKIPVQAVYQEVELPIHVFDYRSMDGDEKVESIKNFEDSDRSMGFDFKSPPLMRIALFRLDENRYRMLWSSHHILFDGWSRAVIIEEVLKTYELIASGKTVPATEEDRYEDYIRFIERIEKGKERKYWTNYLKELEQSTLLPFIGTTAERNKGLGLYKSMHLATSPQVSAEIEKYGQLHRVTLNTIMQGIWAWLLHRYTGSDNVVYGAIVSGRPDDLPGIERRVGMFINTLPLHTSFRADLSISSWLQGLQEEQVSSRGYQYTPLSEVQGWSTVKGDMFDSLFIFENYPISRVLESGQWKLKVSNVKVIEQTNYPLTLIVTSGEKIDIEFVYNIELLKEEYVQEISRHFENVLLQFVNKQKATLKDIQLLTREEQLLLTGFNDTKRDYPANKTIVNLFEEQVEISPDRIAILFGEKKITFKELNDRSNQLAYYLISKGIAEESVVPICLERNVDMLVGLLAILKAGGAYVPIDPEYPSDRISYMLEDSGGSFVVSNTLSKAKLTSHSNLEIIDLDSDWTLIKERPTQNLQTEFRPDQLAYIIYTSGSTGKPKGVMIEHRNVYSFICWCREEFASSRFDIVYAGTSICFDLSVFEIFYPLSIGKKIRILQNGLEIGQYLADDHDVLVNTVPTVIQNLLREETGLENITVMNMAGEPIPLQVLEGLDAEKIEIRNLYGPTEDTTYSTIFRLRNGSPALIGKPISNTQVFIVDKEMELVPIGLAGEICIAGAGLARGYLNREELTAEKFVPNPFCNEPVSRLYRTGDLGRWLPDGNIEYLGRMDNQVKIRGYRIELGEIENVLQQYEKIRESVVLAIDDQQGNKILVGYVVPEGPLDRSALSGYLKSKLPEYMVPGTWMELPDLPLTANGKINRKALPNPTADHQLLTQYVAPRTETEKALTRIWKELLPIESAGINDDFFQLGGHSLLAMRVISFVRKELETEISIKALFLYPTIRELANHIDSQNKGLSLPPITVMPRPQHTPLSFSQERLWFIDKLEGTLHYHLPSILHFKGLLNIEALSYALQQIVNRHEVLRTVILEEGAAGFQYIKEKDNWRLNVENDSFSGDHEMLQSYFRQLIRKPFDLSRDNMIRADLIKLSEDDHVLVVTMHHIASDGWSMSIIVKELVEFYSAFEENRPVRLLPLQIQYADYAIWQREYLQGEILQKKISYWKERLQGVTTLQLPTDFIRPAIQSIRGARTRFAIDKELSKKISDFSQQQGVTLFMTLLAAFKVLLHRYSGQADICVGTPIANRNQYEVESLIGFFINTLALRSNLAQNPSFTGLLEQVKDTTLEAYAHQEVPFEKVVEAVVTERDMSRNPVFQVMLSLQNTPEVPDLKLGGLSLSLEDTEHTTSQLDIICNVTETGDGMVGSVEYCTDLYTEQTINRMMSHYRQLLFSITEAPQKGIDDLQMLTEDETRQLLVDFNDTSVDNPLNKTIIDLFEEQSAENADAISAVFENSLLTFKELNERSNQLAGYLKGKGVKEDILVPVCIGRSLEMLVAILGILKAGGAYVPIDPEYPADRISYLLGDTGASIILSSTNSVSKLPDTNELDVIVIEDDWSVISLYPKENKPSGVQPNHLAYVIYTSGSTGKPKGVMIEHKNLLSYLLNNKTRYITSDKNNSGSFIHLSYTFDASLTAMFMPLLSGKSVVIGSKQSFDVFEDDNLPKYAPYDFIKITPSHLELLQPKIRTGKGWLTKKLVIGGEALFMSHFNYLVEEGLDVEIINEYGPTEATVGCSTYSFQTAGNYQQQKNDISIGKPIDNVQLYILSEQLALLPVGVPGEIYIAGAGVARGYLNRPALSEERFINNPFSNKLGARMYKTGDLARWLPDGNIEYLGRIDDQVKVRGYRIELGEIESVLQQCGEVKQAVVLAKADSTGNKKLVAYVVPADEFHKDSIINYVKDKLPEYMVPALWVELETLPLTSNGKVDKKALPDPEAGELINTEYAAPRNEAEQTLAEIWQELLDVERVGIHDNFFELGGDSIIIIQIVSRARRAGIEFQVSDLFTHQTIAKLSAILDQTADNINQSGEQSLLTGTSGLLPIQEWFFERKLKDISHFNQSVLLRVEKSVSEKELNIAFEKLMSHHDALRFTYQQVDGHWQQEYGSAKASIITENLQSVHNGSLSSAIEAIATTHQQKLNIEAGQLIRIVLMQTPDTETHNRLFIVVHHLSIDGVSWRILLEDMDLLLTEIRNGNKPDLGRKSSSYRQWYEALQKYGQSTRLLSQNEYWQKAVINYISLPEDETYNEVVSGKDTAHQISRLDAQQTQRLLQEVPRVYHTEINDLLLSALAKTISNWSKTENVIIGLEGHGRQDISEEIDTTRTVGWFTTLYPVLLEVDLQKGEDALIKGVKEQLRRVPDKGLGYGVLRYINKDEILQDKPCWDLVFNYLGQLNNAISGGKWLSEAVEPKGSGISDDNAISEKLAVTAWIHSGELVMRWTYSRKHYKKQTIEKLAAEYVLNLNTLIMHCMEQEKFGLVFTPSDYGLSSEITYEELDEFLDDDEDNIMTF